MHSHLRHLAPTEAYVWFSAYDLIDRERVWPIEKNFQSQQKTIKYNSSLHDKSIFILSIFILIYLHYLYIDINIIFDLNHY